MLNKTKIICTLGPATDDPQVLEALMRQGMNVARLNFSHGSHAEHQKRVDLLKKLRRELDLPLAIMIDTKGPDIRVGRFADNFVELKSGELFTLCSRPCLGNQERVFITYPHLPEKLHKGDTVMLDDGLIRLLVEEINPDEVVCRVGNGGIIANNKSINVPDISLDIPFMRENDVDDLIFAIRNDFDFIAASFVRNADDVLAIRCLLGQYHAEHIKIIAKIENSEGIENIEEILAISDGIMVARGDLGVEIDFEQVPRLQKMLIKKAAKAGKISITATQMLESMIKNPRPTRAEISDVANAIYDGTGAVMLSGETAAGSHPLDTLITMRRIVASTEQDINYQQRLRNHLHNFTADITLAIGYATCSLAIDLEARAILASTLSGFTANAVSRFRPVCPVIACTAQRKAYNQLALSWGVIPVLLPSDGDGEYHYQQILKASFEAGLIAKGDKVVMTSGSAPGSGCTDTIRVETVPEFI